MEKWPTNPIDIIIASIRKNPNAVIADFGCGDAKLAQSVPNTVHSFDLVSRNELVVAADMAHVPLLNGSVDIAVYSLALMGTNVKECIRESHRVLKKDGVMKIAEVKSRFETESIGGLLGFVDIMHDLGFDLKKKVNILLLRQEEPLMMYVRTIKIKCLCSLILKNQPGN